jgi:hypothetical protein
MTPNPPDASLSVLQAPCEAIASAAQGVLQWSFDPRFRASAATFATADQESVKTLLGRGFGSCWTSGTIAQAPPRAQELCAKTGGLRPGQLLFGANAESDPILFGAWWPWGNGTTISIRILFSARTLDETSKAALLAEFKGWFGLPD